jgi:hypothetical protein
VKTLFKDLILEDKIKKKIKEYQTFVLKDIFSEYELKEYINGIEKIIQKNDGCHKNNLRIYMRKIYSCIAVSTIVWLSQDYL